MFKIGDILLYAVLFLFLFSCFLLSLAALLEAHLQQSKGKQAIKLNLYAVF
jgi:hypothetical protein